jgi:hypothetical protein
MLKKMNPQQQRHLGIALLVVGILIALRLWWMLPAAILGGIGAYLYIERRKQGRVAAAVQSGLWLVGLSLLLVLDLVFPGIFLLAGGSLLLRGREHEADRRVSGWLSRVGIHVGAVGAGDPHAQAPLAPAAQTPQAQQPDAQAEQVNVPNTGETTRL